MPEGYGLEIFNATQPFDTSKYAMKWDGEWHITIEVFRDLGLAFAAVLMLIYVLVVGWFQSFKTPLLIMAAIPFSLVGILPAHAAMGAFFTATSMIGFIAGAGIVVRNSIILVDFIELRLREGMPLEQAVIDAGAVRFRPMALTAAAVIVGAGVILFDPIFQGLAISLMAGEVASLLLSRMAVPVLYYMAKRARACRGGRHGCLGRGGVVNGQGVPWQWPPRTVLAAVDFSEASARAVAVAGLIASAFDAKFRALHSERFEPPPYFTVEQIERLEAERRGAQLAAIRHLEQFVATATAYGVEPMVVDEPPVEAILHAASDVDFIVMGSHRRRRPQSGGGWARSPSVSCGPRPYPSW